MSPRFLFILDLPCGSNPLDERSNGKSSQIKASGVVAPYVQILVSAQLWQVLSWRLRSTGLQAECAVQTAMNEIITATQLSLSGICLDIGSLSNNFLPRCCAEWESLA